MTERGLKHPGRWIWLLLLVPIGFGFTRLRLDVDVLALLPPELEVVQGLRAYQEHFANARELLISVEATEAEAAESAAWAVASGLRARPDLAVSVIWEPPWLEHPGQAAELIGTLWYNQPPEVFREFTNRLAPERLPALLAAAREQLASSFSPQEIARLSYDPFGFTRLPDTVAGAAPVFAEGGERFSSPDGRFRVLFVQASRELATYRECQHWLDEVKRAVEAALASGQGQASQIRLGYTGRPAFVGEIAAGMEGDMRFSVLGTALIIAILFWLAHRRLKPMLWLLTLLGFTLASTLALGGLIFGAINVVSMGFAAILLGLAVDYAVVHYQEALAHPNLSVPQIRRAIAPSILWAAVTTIAAFLVLNLGGLPGLAQLGTLVGVGVALAAFIMIFEFLPPLFPDRDEPKPALLGRAEATAPSGDGLVPRRGLVLWATVLLGVGSATVVGFGLPRIDATAEALRPKGSQAYETLERVQALLADNHDPLWVVASGATEQEVADRLAKVQANLESVSSGPWAVEFTLPTPLWPNPAFQAANRTTALSLAGQSPLLRQAATEAGFAEGALGLAQGVLDTLRIAASTPGVFWPTNEMSRWIVDKIAARGATNLFAVGMINLPQSVKEPDERARLVGRVRAALPQEGVWLTGWELLGNEIFGRVRVSMWKVLLPMGCLVLLSLWFAFRKPAEILLSLSVLSLSGLCLLAVMRLAGWSWNLLNLMAIPLILGTGVDYGLFMQLALRRYQGNLAVAYRSVGRALLLCGGTGIAGFGSLAFSSNAGMASLGAVCAVGIAANMLIAVFLLPSWWRRWAWSRADGSAKERPPKPSWLYRAYAWRIGLWLAHALPRSVCINLGVFLVRVYEAVAPHRRRIVVENLAPALSLDQHRARAAARRLFDNFIIKIVDLLRFEAGVPVQDQLGEATGWEYFEAARSQHRGILLVTPHLGNWEFGAPFLQGKGVELIVVTLSEPGERFTALREAARARMHVQTMVIGSDPFAFLQIIRRLEEGATVAMLVDRPPPPTEIDIELFGRPFAASVAAAELARASGCALLPVYVVWTGEKYSAHLLPHVPYDRARLRDRLERQRVCHAVMKAFEPVIREHIDQWYHFVPVWGPGEHGAAHGPGAAGQVGAASCGGRPLSRTAT